MNSMDVFLRRAKAALDRPKDDCLTVVFRGLTSDEKREIINRLEAVHHHRSARAAGQLPARRQRRKRTMSCNLNCQQGRRCTCLKSEGWTPLDRVLAAVLWIVTATVCLVMFARSFVV